jgi:hypothetical protein
MFIRLLFATLIISLWTLRRKKQTILWAIFIESIIQVNYMCFAAYVYGWYFLKSETFSGLIGTINRFGYQLGWDAMLLMISVAILIYTFKQIYKNFEPKDALNSDSAVAKPK